MKIEFKKVFPYILMQFVCLLIIPHLFLIHGFRYDSIGALGLFTFIPLSGSLVALMHVLQDGQFCPALILETALAVLSYLIKMELEYVLILSASIIMVCVIEAFALLDSWGVQSLPEEMRRWLLDIVKNKKYLALLTFWAIILVGVVQVSSVTLPIWMYILPSPCIFMLLPLTLLPVFRRSRSDTPLGIGGLIGVFAVFLGSSIVSTTFYLNTRWYLNLGCVIASFMLLLLTEGILTGIGNMSLKKRKDN